MTTDQRLSILAVRSDIVWYQDQLAIIASDKEGFREMVAAMKRDAIRRGMSSRAAERAVMPAEDILSDLYADRERELTEALERDQRRLSERGLA